MRRLKLTPEAGPLAEAPTLLERARTLYEQRRAREKLLPPVANLLGEPSWDLLLDLFIAHESGKAITVTSACAAACVPSTTGLRWLAALEQRGLLHTWPYDQDRRKRMVALTDEGVRMMVEYLDGI